MESGDTHNFFNLTFTKNRNSTIRIRVNSGILNQKPKKVTDNDTDKLKSRWWASCLLERNWGILTISLILPSQKIAIPLSVCVWTLAFWTKIQKKLLMTIPINWKIVGERVVCWKGIRGIIKISLISPSPKIAIPLYVSKLAA